MIQLAKTMRLVRSRSAWIAALAACSLTQGCGPAAIGAALSGGGGGGGDGGGPPMSTVNFIETEPNNDGLTGNFVGSIFPGRTYVISGSHPAAADLDFFGVTASQNVRMQIRLIPAGNADMVLLVGPQIDNGGAGATESFVVDLSPMMNFSSGSGEFNSAATAYTMRLIGQPRPGIVGDDDPPTEEFNQTTYIQLDEQGKVISRVDVTEPAAELAAELAERSKLPASIDVR